MKRVLILATILTLTIAGCDQVDDDSDDPVSDDRTVESTEDDEGDLPDAPDTPTADPDEEQVDVRVRDYGFGETLLGTLKVFGELENHGDQQVEIREILVTLQDDEGSDVDASTVFSFISVAGPGEIIPFQHTFTEGGDNVVDVEIDLEARGIGNGGVVMLNRYREFEAAWVNWRAGDPSPSVLGEVENTGDDAAELVEIFAIGYDADGNVQFVETTYSELEVIDPGDRSPFTITYLDETGQEPAEIRIMAEGWVTEE